MELDNRSGCHPSKEAITPEYVRTLTKPLDQMLCLLQDNNLIRFGEYRIRDIQSGAILMEISEENQAYGDRLAREEELAGNVSLETRTVKYNFGPDFLKLRTIGLKLDILAITEDPIKDLTLIERHYFENKLIREYEFSFGFLIPKSKNTTEFIYDLPKFSDEEMDRIL